MTETELKDAVIELAGWLGWMVHHDRPAQNRRGEWATHIQGDKGFPDLCMARDGHVVFAELKSEKGRKANAQATWALAIATDGSTLTRGGTHSYHEWRPSEWLDGTIERILKGSGPRTSAR